MTHRDDFDRVLATWLVEDAPGREPEGLLPRALVHVRRSYTRGHYKTPKSGRS